MVRRAIRFDPCTLLSIVLGGEIHEADSVNSGCPTPLEEVFTFFVDATNLERHYAAVSAVPSMRVDDRLLPSERGTESSSKSASTRAVPHVVGTSQH